MEPAFLDIPPMMLWHSALGMHAVSPKDVLALVYLIPKYHKGAVLIQNCPSRLSSQG